MRRRLLALLRCPRCAGHLQPDARSASADPLESGALQCRRCGQLYPVRGGIPRFVDSSGYAASFGFQWRSFAREQLDRFNGTRISAERFARETGWSQEWLRGKTVLDVGCGAGRFADIAAATAGLVVGVDVSEAVDAAAENLSNRANVEFVQASVYALPFAAMFDAGFCIGVLQHTPAPAAAARALPGLLRPGGELAVSCYERNLPTLINGRYFIRPLTTRLPARTLLWLVRGVMPVLFALTEVLFRLPVLGRGFRRIVPVANYVRKPELSVRQRYRWAVLDTFDMLSPRFDRPQSRATIEAALTAAGLGDVVRRPSRGLTLVGRRVRPSTG